MNNRNILLITCVAVIATLVAVPEANSSMPNRGRDLSINSILTEDLLARPQFIHDKTSRKPKLGSSKSAPSIPVNRGISGFVVFPTQKAPQHRVDPSYVTYLGFEYKDCQFRINNTVSKGLITAKPVNSSLISVIKKQKDDPFPENNPNPYSGFGNTLSAIDENEDVIHKEPSESEESTPTLDVLEELELTTPDIFKDLKM